MCRTKSKILEKEKLKKPPASSYPNEKKNIYIYIYRFNDLILSLKSHLLTQQNLHLEKHMYYFTNEAYKNVVENPFQHCEGDDDSCISVSYQQAA